MSTALSVLARYKETQSPLETILTISSMCLSVLIYKCLIFPDLYSKIEKSLFIEMKNNAIEMEP